MSVVYLSAANGSTQCKNDSMVNQSHCKEDYVFMLLPFVVCSTSYVPVAVLPKQD